MISFFSGFILSFFLINSDVQSAYNQYKWTTSFYLQSKILLFLLVIAFFATAILMIIIYKHRHKIVHLKRTLEDRTNELIKERTHSEEIINDQFSSTLLDGQRVKGRTTSKKYDLVTVLFCDIQGFTKIAQTLNPEILIDKLDSFFFHFDTVISKYNIEKIKTIGDAYMCAGGIPRKNSTNPIEVILAALEMLEYMMELKKTESNIWDLRIGIHTGPVIAGIVGQKKLSFDIWGDSVNTASRLESSGFPNKINISQETFNLAKKYFHFEHRGKMPVKYKGNIDMYFVDGIKEAYADGKFSKPNRQFLTEIQLLRLTDMEKELFFVMENKLDEKIYYHNVKHAFDLLTNADLYGKAEDLSDVEMLMLKTCALLYDIYYLQSNYEISLIPFRSIDKYLKEFKYSSEQIEQIHVILDESRQPHIAINKVARLLSDCNYDYLGRADYMEIFELQYKEEIELKGFISKQEWISGKLNFILSHEFYTRSAQKLREISREEIIQELKRNFK